jgi:septal ring factor EnvC (AmiA/AmiB activator)
MFKNRVNGLVSKSANVLNVFTETLKKLNAVNTEISKEYNKQEAAKLKAVKNQDILTQQQSTNAKLISNIESFLGNESK